MGTDFLSFVREAFRVLKSDGQLWISEIKSRFGDKDAKNFVETLKKIGFKLVDRDDNNKMFIQLDFVRGKERKRATDVVEQQDTKKVGTLLKPCTYKKR
ncbi:Ribosomal RNA-processing protein [Taphrina deformans PYCC 5710]|uniref:Ribosomal RNA-processing protein 8 n=1 Tax=Taphrina deformans (strain PYCC 5710 / ATCC 11124 / CBS 356.35 / IMI 108563 / JCM 9778 / NBRC 8474) TaxID=1097556 RepID=R4X8D7_TAPDE|nr:Ribosomal RNA-processing protein [Taphrina deformans PYCC 5710]|eukprot:CCG81542.1 Ribosomal RNA-processing protein [Taphrina deformans PYCC 5710]